MGNIIRDIWSPLERETTYSGAGQALPTSLPAWVDPPGNFEQFSPAAPKKELLAGMLIGAGRGGWALSIELVRVLSGERWTNDEALSGTPSDTFQPSIVCQTAAIGGGCPSTRRRVNPEFPQSLISDGSVVDVWWVGGRSMWRKA